MPIERELRKLGRTIHRRSRPGRADARGVSSLTGRELDVARLVVDRRTNRLDASSRVEVARILEASG